MTKPNPIAFGPLRSRETPRQARAVARVQTILQATAEILNKQTIQDLSTTAIADHAGIPVSSIYRYFPTLNAVLHELHLQTSHALRKDLFAAFADTAAHPGWRHRLNAALDIQRRYLARHPYYRPLLLHFMVNRSAIAIENDDHKELTDFLQARWAAGADGFANGDPVVVADTTIQIALSMEDLIAAKNDRDTSRPYSVELSKVLESYLAQYLSD